MKVMHKKSQTEGLRILILSFLAHSTSNKTLLAHIFTLIFYPHILLFHLSAWTAHPWSCRNCSFKGHQGVPAKFNLLFYLSRLWTLCCICVNLLLIPHLPQLHTLLISGFLSCSYDQTFVFLLPLLPLPSMVLRPPLFSIPSLKSLLVWRRGAGFPCW